MSQIEDPDAATATVVSDAKDYDDDTDGNGDHISASTTPGGPGQGDEFQTEAASVEEKLQSASREIDDRTAQANSVLDSKIQAAKGIIAKS